MDSATQQGGIKEPKEAFREQPERELRIGDKVQAGPGDENRAGLLRSSVNGRLHLLSAGPGSTPSSVLLSPRWPRYTPCCPPWLNA